jgi:hypothetical protein
VDCVPAKTRQENTASSAIIIGKACCLPTKCIDVTRRRSVEAGIKLSDWKRYQLERKFLNVNDASLGDPDSCGNNMAQMWKVCWVGWQASASLRVRTEAKPIKIAIVKVH